MEDNENDVLLTREGFKRAKVPARLHHVENGEKCMAFLRRSGKYADAPTPDIVLLDLNMPVMDGREVLEQIVADPELCRLPVVVLTTSEGEQDILRMYRLRCSSYIVKPVDFLAFADVVKITFYLTDIRHKSRVWDARKEIFAGARPASTLVEVVHLVDPTALVEIDAIAHLRSGGAAS